MDMTTDLLSFLWPEARTIQLETAQPISKTDLFL